MPNRDRDNGLYHEKRNTKPRSRFLIFFYFISSCSQVHFEGIDTITMSSVIPVIHLEVISPATSIPRASTDSPLPTPERDGRPQDTVESNAPAEGQPVFTHAQLRATTKTRQIAITALIILSNLIQVRLSLMHDAYLLQG